MNQLNLKTLYNYLGSIYKNADSNEIQKISNQIKKIFENKLDKKPDNELWNEKDCFLITYADSIIKEKQINFKTLGKFLNKYCNVTFKIRKL